MKGLQRLIRRRREKKRIKGHFLGAIEAGGGTHQSAMPRLCIKPSVHTFGTLSDVSSWKEMSEEPHALELPITVSGS